MKPEQSSDIRSLFVLHDELGYPIRFEVHEKDPCHANLPFMSFVRSIVKINREGWYVHKGQFCCYDITPFHFKQSDALQFRDDGQQLSDFIGGKNPQKVYDFPYRTVHYLCGTTGQTFLQDLIDAKAGTHCMQKQVDTWLADKESLEQNPITRPTTEAFVTERGAIFFDGSGISLQHRHQYLQYLTDQYFSRSPKPITFLNRYGGLSNDTLQTIAIRQNGMFSPTDGRFVEKPHLYAATELLQGLRHHDHYQFGLGYNNFYSFSVSHGQSINDRNLDIQRLLYIKEFSYIPIFNDEDQRRFSWREQFRNIDKMVLMNAPYQGLEIGKALSDRIRSESRQIAERLLQEHYGLTADPRDLHNCLHSLSKQNQTQKNKTTKSSIKVK